MNGFNIRSIAIECFWAIRLRTGQVNFGNLHQFAGLPFGPERSKLSCDNEQPFTQKTVGRVFREGPKLEMQLPSYWRRMQSDCLIRAASFTFSPRCTGWVTRSIDSRARSMFRRSRETSTVPVPCILPVDTFLGVFWKIRLGSIFGAPFGSGTAYARDGKLC